jgi:Glycoside hydrolase family 2 C-terminal domain 5
MMTGALHSATHTTQKKDFDNGTSYFSLIKLQPRENVDTNPGLIQILLPAPVYKRKLFNGLAQVIVQSTREAGEIILKATGNGLRFAEVKLQSK